MLLRARFGRSPVAGNRNRSWRGAKSCRWHALAAMSHMAPDAFNSASYVVTQLGGATKRPRDRLRESGAILHAELLHKLRDVAANRDRSDRQPLRYRRCVVATPEHPQDLRLSDRQRVGARAAATELDQQFQDHRAR